MRDERRLVVYEVVRRHRRGESVRAIALAVRIARKTVKNILSEQEERREQGESAVERELPPQRTPRASKLDPYQEQIAAWLDEFPNLTAVRLREKLREQGFEGRYTIVRMYLKKWRAKKQPAARAVQIVETLPGQQGQFDWSPCPLENDLVVQLWSFTLSWCRARCLRAHDNSRQSTIFRCLVESFEELGGVPEEAVTDSMPGVVDRWECDRPILNIRCVDFAAYYGFALHIAPRGDGAYKGKVERGFRDVKGNLLNGRHFYSREEFAAGLAWWVPDEYMPRPHPTVADRTRLEMLEQERPYLKALPRCPYDTRDVGIRLVDSTAHVLHETNFYPVPEEQIGELVYVCAGPDRLEIFDRGVHRLAEHDRLPDGAGKRIRDPARARRGHYDVQLLAARLASWGPLAENFASQLRTRKRYVGPELNFILGLQVRWSADDIVKSLAHAAKYHAYDARAVERILEAKFSPRRFDEQLADTTRARIRGLMNDHPVHQRSLHAYAALRTGDRRNTQEDTDVPKEPAQTPDGDDHDRTHGSARRTSSEEDGS